MLSPKRILVVNQRYFGDALIGASLCVRLRELFPQTHIALRSSPNRTLAQAYPGSQSANHHLRSAPVNAL